MFHLILSTVLKASTFLQTPDNNLSTAMEVVDSSKEPLKNMRNEEHKFQNTYEKTIEICTGTVILIPTAKKKMENVTKSR